MRVLIVDDSAFMRTAIRKMLQIDPDIEVVGEARNGQVALEMVEQLAPDVITMDVEMPEMDGLTATREIMRRTPTPIIMISSLTERGAATTLKALEYGAVDFISKQSSFVQLDIVQIGEELLGKVRHWARGRGRRHAGAMPPATISAAASAVLKKVVPQSPPRLIVIGVSTGGPAALPQMLAAMGRLTCPVVIAQHMPPLFTKSLAATLKGDSGLDVVEGEDAMPLLPGRIVIAPGGTDSVVREPLPGQLSLHHRLRPDLPIHPSVDLLFSSAAVLNGSIAAVVLTGMGCDGAKGARELAAKGAPVLVQEPTTCVVDGMPGATLAAGAASDVLSLADIGRRLKRWAGA